ncbi:hypothetical protein [Streptomyces sp. 150FB]|uniref:hypothetical protein n=1 Tax=Streptomyces sp. 150FB TaxID=1576605 RepID=UPI0006961B54|nr:hypothetical protein [Streptomyces sp. 150FB]
MRPAHRRARPALLVAAGLLLSACGIPTTGVVESGAPATGIQSPTLIYFVRDGVLIPVPRKTGREADAVTAMHMLLQGPNGDEQQAGVKTEIPPLTGQPKIWNRGKTGLSIQLPPVTGPLSIAALNQLICTTAHAHHTQDPHVNAVQVTVTYSSGDSGVWRTDTANGGCSLATSSDAVRPSTQPTWNGSERPALGGATESPPDQG